MKQDGCLDLILDIYLKLFGRGCVSDSQTAFFRSYFYYLPLAPNTNPSDFQRSRWKCGIWLKYSSWADFIVARNAIRTEYGVTSGANHVSLYERKVQAKESWHYRSWWCDLYEIFRNGFKWSRSENHVGWCDRGIKCTCYFRWEKRLCVW